MSIDRPPVLRMLWRLRRAPRAVPTPLRYYVRSRATFLPTLLMEAGLAVAGGAPFDLKLLAEMRTSSLVGCPW